jgi:hypothetical protein
VSFRDDGTRSEFWWDIRSALLGWLLARVLVAGGAIMAYASVDRLLGNTNLPSLRDGLLSWDAAFYRDIATVGYGGLPEEALRFYPLHPLISRAFDFVLPGGVDVALVVEANLFALLAGAMFHRLVRREFDIYVAGRAVWMFSLFPSAFVLVFGYSESLMLFGLIGAFDAARREKWWQAALFGLIAGASRPLGLALVLPMAIEAARTVRTADWKNRIARLAAIGAPAVSTLAYLLYVEIRFGDGLLPLRTQSRFRGDFVDPITRIFRGFGDLAGTEALGDGLHIPFALVFLGLLGVVAVRLPASYTVFTATLLFVSLDAENLNSLERYGLNAFPLIIGLALVSRDPRIERVILTTSGALLSMLTALALLGAYVP